MPPSRLEAPAYYPAETYATQSASDDQDRPSDTPTSGRTSAVSPKSLVISKAPAKETSAARTARKANELKSFLGVASSLMTEAQNVTAQLGDPYSHTHAEALARTLRTLIRMAKDVQLYRTARVARGLELYAQSLSNGTIELRAADWILLAETQNLLLRMLNKLAKFGDEGLCEQETAEAKCWLLTHRPEIARLVVQLSD